MFAQGLGTSFGTPVISNVFSTGIEVAFSNSAQLPVSIPASTSVTGLAQATTTTIFNLYTSSNLAVNSNVGFLTASGVTNQLLISGLPSSFGTVTLSANATPTNPSYLPLTFGASATATIPYTVPVGAQIGATTINPTQTTGLGTPSSLFTLPVQSTTGFLPGQVINTYASDQITLAPFAAMQPLTINSISTTNSTLTCNFQGTYSAITLGNAVTWRSSGLTLTSNILPGGSSFQLPVNSATGFAAGQTLSSYLGLNMGTVTITSATAASGSAGANLALNFTGSFPTGNPIPIGTTVQTLPAGSNLTIVTDVAHGIPTTGATTTIRNFTTTAINGTGYTITGVTDSRTVNVQTQQTLTSGIINLGEQPRLVMTNWHGSTVRAGTFEDPNGLFWEYDGQTLSVVRRQSTFVSAGYVTVSPLSQVLIGTTLGSNSFINSGVTVTGFTTGIGETSNIFNLSGTGTLHNITSGQYTQLPGLGYAWVIGQTDFYQVSLGFLLTTSKVTITPAQLMAAAFWTPTTRFQDQYKVNDRFTIRGMTHQVTSIQGQGIMTFNPPYRGASAITSAAPVKACKIKELRVPQAQFNRDTIDGKGPSGYKVDLSRQQMIGLQYTWYGAGFVDFMIRGPDGNWIMCHRIKNNNVNDEAYMRSGNLPVRYELSVECRAAVSTLASSITATQTTLTINDTTAFFPAANAYLLVDNEYIYYTGTTTNSFTGCTRAASISYVISDTSRTFTGQAASTHLANTSVNLISCSATPTMTHWGSSFLTDGQFDIERGYYFNYSNTQVSIAASPNPSVTLNGSPAFAIRLAPSVTSGLVGDIGQKELLNRAQLLLQKLEVTSPNNIITVGFLNPSNVYFQSSSWVNINTLGNGTQPSFAQYYPGNAITTIPLPGERIFQTIVQGNNQNNLDLSSLKEMANSTIGGNQPFPDGPDVLLVYCQNLSAVPVTAQVNLFWSEAQA